MAPLVGLGGLDGLNRIPCNCTASVLATKWTNLPANFRKRWIVYVGSLSLAFLTLLGLIQRKDCAELIVICLLNGMEGSCLELNLKSNGDDLTSR
jgi:hypothetical protein